MTDKRTCPGCGSVGFFTSALGPGRCSFCDGTEAGCFHVNDMPDIPTLATHYTLTYFPTDGRWLVRYFCRSVRAGERESRWLLWDDDDWHPYQRGSGCDSLRHIPGRPDFREAPTPAEVKKTDAYMRRVAHATQEARRLADKGYRRVSNKYQLVARVDRPDWMDVLATAYHTSPAKFILKDGTGRPDPTWEAHYMRSFSRDQVHVGNREVFLLVPGDRHEPTGYVPQAGDASAST